MQIRALREADDRSRFHSGDPDLDRFLLRFAGQNQFRHYVGVTYVAVDDSGILGFATVAPGHVEIEGLPLAERKKVPRYPLPVLRLARLAVDRSFQRQGLGARILRFVLQLAERMAADFGCVGVVVDAKPEAIGFYTQYGFMALEAVMGRSEARPQPIPLFLAMRAIKGAVKG